MTSCKAIARWAVLQTSKVSRKGSKEQDVTVKYKKHGCYKILTQKIWSTN